MSMIRMVVMFLRIGVLSFGGGWTIVGLIRDEALRGGWLTEEQFTRIVALAQVTPGPVALNTATLVGFRNFGIFGAMAATLAVVAFPMAGVALAAFIAVKIGPRRERVMKALQGATLAMVAMTLVSLSVSPDTGILTYLIAAAALLLSVFTKPSPLVLIFGAGIAGGLAEIFF